MTNSRTHKGQFLKGTRPVGRQKGTKNKTIPEVRLIAQLYGEDAIEELARIMRQSASDDSRIAAAKEILNRGFGRPPTTYNLAGWDGGPLDVATLTDEQLEALAERFAAMLPPSESANSI